MFFYLGLRFTIHLFFFTDRPPKAEKVSSSGRKKCVGVEKRERKVWKEYREGRRKEEKFDEGGYVKG